MRTASLFEADRLTLEDSLEMSVANVERRAACLRAWALGDR